MHQQHSKAADVYSFGIVLWELMTWQVPWDGYNHFQVQCSLRAGPYAWFGVCFLSASWTNLGCTVHEYCWAPDAFVASSKYPVWGVKAFPFAGYSQQSRSHTVRCLQYLQSCCRCSVAHTHDEHIRFITCVLVMQIMFMLAREQARPEIPDFSTLPGPHWSGIKGFVDVMKVTTRASFVLHPVTNT